MAGVVVSATLRGGDAALRKFAKLERGARRQIVSKAVRKGLRPQLRAAKSTSVFSDRTGNLRRSLTTSVRANARAGTAVGKVTTSKRRMISVGPSKKAGFRGGPLEFGHRIAVSAATGASQAGHVLDRIGKDRRPRKLSQYQAVSAGFVAPRPFMRLAFQSTTQQAERAFTTEFVAGVNREVASG